jgi:hypothetical protein
VFQSPTTRIYQLDGACPSFDAAGYQRRDRRLPNGDPRRGATVGCTVPAGSDHITLAFVPPDTHRALLGLPAGVGLMLLSTGRTASSFGVRR